MFQVPSLKLPAPRPTLLKKLLPKKGEEFGFEGYGKDNTEYRSPEMCAVAYVTGSSFGHIGRVNEVQYAKNRSGNSNGYQEKKNLTGRV